MSQNAPQTVRATADAAPWPWRARMYGDLGPAFATPSRPVPLQGVHQVCFNRELARTLGWSDWLCSGTGSEAGAVLRPEALQVLAGNRQPPGSAPVATVYSGHQFGVWAGQLGDGRAVLLGELDSNLGAMELQLKGSGPTRFSRMGDGRAVLRSSIREYLCSEAMHALGIPTTRALALIGAADPVYRETVETAAVLSRVAPGFVRFGHFEHFSANGQLAALRQLADYVIERHGSELAAHSGIAPEDFDGAGAAYQCLLAQVSELTASLLADWQAIGFVHGVMNTDNMSVLGLTLDYGPFQFLDGFEPSRITNHSDRQSRYVLQRQPAIGYWNLLALGQAMAPLIGDDEKTVAAVDGYKTAFPRHFARRMMCKLGGAQADEQAVNTILTPLFTQMAQERTDYTIFWRRLSHAAASDDYEALRSMMLERTAFDGWIASYREWLQRYGQQQSVAAMLRANPCCVLRNHLAEVAIGQAQQGDFSELERLMTALAHPYDELPGMQAYTDFAPDWAQHLQVSCSS